MIISPKLEDDLRKVIAKTKTHAQVGSVSLEVSMPNLGKRFDFSEREGELFFAASVTKMVTSASFLALQKSEQLSLSDPISKYLTKEEERGLVSKGKRDLSKELTIGKLLANQSGIPDYFQAKRLDPASDIEKVTSQDPGWSFSDAIQTAKSMPSALGKIRGRAHYSFTNYQILSEILERATNKALSQVLNDEVLQPAGLVNTFLFEHESLDRVQEIAPLKYFEKNYYGFRRMASLRGEGALVSTTSDLIGLLRYLTRNKASGSLVDTMKQQLLPLFPFVRYGLGIMQMKVPGLLVGAKRTPRLLGHLGATGAFAFIEEHSGALISGTVNQIGNPALGSQLLLKVASKITKHLKPGPA